MQQKLDLKISIGPAPFNWGRKSLMDFYCNQLPETSVDSVYIGNTICHKRNILSPEDFQTIVETLHKHEISVYYSTLALSTTPEEYDYLKTIYSLFDGIEINMIGYLNLLQDNEIKQHNKKIILGPYLNIYNWKSADYLRRYEPSNLVAPFELSLESIADIAEKSSIPVEVTAWGSLPTALSWRCYTARAFDRSRENCQKICFDYPTGMNLKTVENEDLFRIDGLQVTSARTHCLIESLPKLAELGISTIRIYPQQENTATIIQKFQEVINGETKSKAGLDDLTCFAPEGLCNGWSMGDVGWEYVAA